MAFFYFYSQVDTLAKALSFWFALEQVTTNMTGSGKISEYFASQWNKKAVVIIFSHYIVKILPTSYFWVLWTYLAPSIKNDNANF